MRSNLGMSYLYLLQHSQDFFSLPKKHSTNTLVFETTPIPVFFFDGKIPFFDWHHSLKPGVCCRPNVRQMNPLSPTPFIWPIKPHFIKSLFSPQRELRMQQKEYHCNAREKFYQFKSMGSWFCICFYEMLVENQGPFFFCFVLFFFIFFLFFKQFCKQFSAQK